MEQPGKFLPCPSRAGHRYPEDMADPLRRLPSTTEDLQVVIPCRNRALFLQRGIRITLHGYCRPPSLIPAMIGVPVRTKYRRRVRLGRASGVPAGAPGGRSAELPTLAGSPRA